MPRGRKPAVVRAPKEQPNKPSASPSPAAFDGRTEDQRRGLLLTHIVKLEKLGQIAKTANSDIRNHRKLMKADGFEREEVDFMLLARRVPETTIRSMFETYDRVLAYLAHPVGRQFDLLDPDDDRAPAIDVAREAGKTAGLEGLRCDPKPAYDASSPQGREWIEGWHQGQAVLKRGFKPLSGMPSAKAEKEDDPRPQFLKDREGERETVQ